MAEEVKQKVCIVVIINVKLTHCFRLIRNWRKPGADLHVNVAALCAPATVGREGQVDSVLKSLCPRALSRGPRSLLRGQRRRNNIEEE